jgi:hypothetical protein
LIILAYNLETYSTVEIFGSQLTHFPGRYWYKPHGADFLGVVDVKCEDPSFVIF